MAGTGETIESGTKWGKLRGEAEVTEVCMTKQALRARAAAGGPKASRAREFGMSRQTLYQYLSPPVPAPS